MSVLPDRCAGRAAGESKVRQSEANRQARAARLDRSKVAAWTALVQQVGKHVVQGKRPCSYEPWQAALREVSRDPSYAGKPPEDWHWAPTELMSFAADVAQPGWPEPRSDLIEFALTFLEADVMLLRSGYAKRHLVRRLQQSQLTEEQISRVDALLRRAVTRGTGLEEFRAFRKLAAHLCVRGHLPDVADWLASQSEGAILTTDRADGELFAKIVGSPGLSEEDRNRLMSVGLFRPSRWGIVYPQMNEVVRAGKLVQEPAQRVKYNAFQMLEAIRRRQASEPMS